MRGLWTVKLNHHFLSVVIEVLSVCIHKAADQESRMYIPNSKLPLRLPWFELDKTAVPCMFFQVTNAFGLVDTGRLARAGAD